MTYILSVLSARFQLENWSVPARLGSAPNLHSSGSLEPENSSSNSSLVGGFIWNLSHWIEVIYHGRKSGFRQNVVALNYLQRRICRIGIKPFLGWIKLQAASYGTICNVNCLKKNPLTILFCQVKFLFQSLVRRWNQNRIWNALSLKEFLE